MSRLLWVLCVGLLSVGCSKRLVQSARGAGASLLNDVNEVGEADERRIGAELSARLVGACKPVADAALQQYVNRVGRWVAAQGERPGLPWTFAVLDCEDINAFAAPGGYVFVTRGLYRELRSEAELAGVLGHEITHVNERHHLKLLLQGKLLEKGAERLGRETGGQESSVRLVNMGAEVFARSLDKRAELESDRHGVVLAARAGDDAFAFLDLLDRLASRGADESQLAFLYKTHPPMWERREALEQAIGTRFDTLGGSAPALKAQAP